MTEALCRLIGNIKKEEMERKKKHNCESLAASRENRHCVSGRWTQEFQPLARRSLDRAGINLLAFA